jgi:hypothetical protein
MRCILTRPRKTSRQLLTGRGFSLLEVLLGSAFLMVIVLGVLAMFTQAVVSNEAGAASMNVTNLARSRIEELSEAPFNGESLVLDSGSEKVTDRYFSQNLHQWIDGQAPTDGSDRAIWMATTTIRQYNNNAWDDGALDPAEALAATTPTEFVHFKEIQVRVEGGDQASMLGTPRRITLRSLRSK